MRMAIREFALSGKPVYAECGGLMYLTGSIQDSSGSQYPMVGVFPFDAVMDHAKAMIGYRSLEITRPCLLGGVGVKARGHEFHYSYLRPKDSIIKSQYACLVSDAKQSRHEEDGLVAHNTLALYTHLHFGSQPLLAQALVKSAQ